MGNYCTMLLKISKDDIKSFLSNFYSDEDLDNMDAEDEATETVSGILSDHFSDYYVLDKNTIVVGDID